MKRVMLIILLIMQFSISNADYELKNIDATEIEMLLKASGFKKISEIGGRIIYERGSNGKSEIVQIDYIYGKLGIISTAASDYVEKSNDKRSKWLNKQLISNIEMIALCVNDNDIKKSIRAQTKKLIEESGKMSLGSVRINEKDHSINLNWSDFTRNITLEARYTP